MTFFLFSYANYLDRQHSEQDQGKRKVAQLRRQQFLSLDSQSMKEKKGPFKNIL